MKMSGMWLAVSVTLMCGSVFAQTTDFPRRKSGMWEAKIESARIPGGVTTQECVDEKTDAEMQKQGIMGKNNGKYSCRLISSKKTAKGWEYDSECKNPQLTVNAHTVISGDMQSAYSVDSLARFDPPMMGQKEMRTQIKLRYAGVCKAGMQPGDVSFNGMKMNMSAGKGGKAPDEAEIRKMIEEMTKAQKQ